MDRNPRKSVCIRGEVNFYEELFPAEFLDFVA